MNNSLNKTVQFIIVCVLFPLGISSIFFNALKLSDNKTNNHFVGEDKLITVKNQEITEPKPNCHLPNIKSDNTNIEYSDNGNSLVRILNILPESDGSYMEVTLDSPGSINFERYFGNTSESFDNKFCYTIQDNTTPMAVGIFFGPRSKPGVLIPFNQMYKIGTFTGNKMYFSIPIDQDLYISTDKDVIPKTTINLLGK
jgi:hypothetical protein